jgi:predicted TIM-barrel fold metal-dependent hydrolase
MRDGFRIIDCDRHVIEPADLWDKYLDTPYKHYVGWHIQPSDGVAARLDDSYWRGAFKHAVSGGFDSRSYLADLDREGIDIGVLFSTLGLGFPWYDDLEPDVQDAMCRAYNNWLHDFCSLAPDRMFGMALLPLKDVSLAERELRRAVEELGMRGIFWRPNPHFGRLISDKAYEPLLAAAQQYGVPIGYHEGQHGHRVVLDGGIDMSPPRPSWKWLGSGRIETSYLGHSARHPMEQMGAFLTLACEGVFDRYPDLHFAFLESGCGWLPYWLERLDVFYANPVFRDGYQSQLTPSAYFKRGQCYISSEAEESETLGMLARTVGEECLMWASDYPHRDAVMYFPDTPAGVTENQHISAELKHKVLWENPARFYRLPVDGAQAKRGELAAATA